MTQVREKVFVLDIIVIKKKIKQPQVIGHVINGELEPKLMISINSTRRENMQRYSTTMAQILSEMNDKLIEGKMSQFHLMMKQR